MSFNQRNFPATSMQTTLLNTVPADAGEVIVEYGGGIERARFSSRERYPQPGIGSTMRGVDFDKAPENLQVFVEDRTSGQIIHIADLPYPVMEMNLPLEDARRRHSYTLPLGGERSLELVIGLDIWQVMKLEGSAVEGIIEGAREKLRYHTVELSHLPARSHAQDARRSFTDRLKGFFKE